MKTSKGERMNICFLGKINVGKSTVINRIIGQDVSIVSEQAGTTTDAVSKRFELIPAGPVTFFDTAGLDDNSPLKKERLNATMKVIFKSDLAVLVLDNNGMHEVDINCLQRLNELKLPFIVLWNKSDLAAPDAKTREYCNQHKLTLVEYNDLKAEIIKRVDILRKHNESYVIRDLIGKDDLIVQVMPQDDAAPKGRVILPQVVVLREVLDSDAIGVCCTDKNLKQTLATLSKKPFLVVTDSQVVDAVQAAIPPDVFFTTYSILFARYKGELATFLDGLKELKELKEGDEVLIFESCSHNITHSDIAEVKIPGWLKKYLGFELKINKLCGYNFPDDLEKYKLVIHCGGCMVTRTEVLRRVSECKRRGVPITNYGLIICQMQGCLERAIEIFKN